MSEILKIFVDSNRSNGPFSRYLILDCGHWYRWTGKEAPKVDADADFPCPDCKPPIVVMGVEK